MDPDISPAAPELQVAGVAHERDMKPDDVRMLVQHHTLGRLFGFLGEPRVIVLELNLDLDAHYPLR
jgi:K+-transporting ATPase ATPase C chain